MVMVTILSSIVFLEEMYVGRVVGSVIIVIGIYLVLRGKSKDRKGTVPSKGECPETVVKIDEDDIISTPDKNNIAPKWPRVTS
ncbi:hypothetical protein Bca52824_005342 [Brassica carinata]|uniref:WAT1-related protein n=1 Tax=Brassica carinata TaxID=52824 RepID=A0A8X8BG71_BRACI|nr:hypothetical protein Bca52824_005342 [Brassica carinata]